ncbi:pyrroloquinoline quinone-dependent dehydrogenase [Bradyrhizobium sp.]|uniref:pyrroloquinoline quinone-dependent dehydrogenase n=1 Tax=Bradyrhizobium sp. TaxID=376 RepID=UPI003BB0A3BD
MSSMKNKLLIIAGVLVAIVATAGGTVNAYWDQVVPLAGMAINYARSWSAPSGTTTTELAAAAPEAAGAPVPSPSSAARPSEAAAGHWPSYNKTLTSERYSQLSQINTTNVGKLKVLCTYDTGQYTSFETGPIMVNNALIGTTEHDIFSLDPTNCHENWRTHEDYKPASLLAVNRGAAYMDGLLFRGTEDGRVLAYDFKTGKRVWETTVADPKLGESTPAAPIAWDGLVFIGNAGGDNKGVKGRMYALDAKTGKIVWEFYLVPKTAGDPIRGPQGATPLNISTWKNASGTPITGGGTWTSYTLDPTTGELFIPGGNPAPDFATGPREGTNLYSGSVVVLDAKTGAYKSHFKLVPKDWHDWDVSTAPALIQTRGGKKLLSVAPKDGHLYGFDLATNTMLYRTPTTRIENAEAPFATTKAVHFCPGTVGGAEWNGPAYDPQTNLILIGEVDWCATVTLQKDKDIQAVSPGKPWSAMATINPYDTYGVPDSFGDWAGWVYAVDADTGVWKWRLKSNYPILSGMTPTAGGIAFFGDMGGNFYALNAANGQRLWGQKIGGAIGGGVITYTAKGAQRVAVATGFTSILWPTEVVTGKITILGLGDALASR